MPGCLTCELNPLSCDTCTTVGYYKSGTVCKPCPAGCKKCTSSGCDSNGCMNNFVRDSTGKCLQCNENCLTCSDATDTSKCNSCP